MEHGEKTLLAERWCGPSTPALDDRAEVPARRGRAGRCGVESSTELRMVRQGEGGVEVLREEPRQASGNLDGERPRSLVEALVELLDGGVEPFRKLLEVSREPFSAVRDRRVVVRAVRLRAGAREQRVSALRRDASSSTRSNRSAARRWRNVIASTRASTLSGVVSARSAASASSCATRRAVAPAPTGPSRPSYE
jgi:hypothetical protein